MVMTPQVSFPAFADRATGFAQGMGSLGDIFANGPARQLQQLQVQKAQQDLTLAQQQQQARQAGLSGMANIFGTHQAAAPSPDFIGPEPGVTAATDFNTPEQQSALAKSKMALVMSGMKPEEVSGLALSMGSGAGLAPQDLGSLFAGAGKLLKTDEGVSVNDRNAIIAQNEQNKLANIAAEAKNPKGGSLTEFERLRNIPTAQRTPEENARIGMLTLGKGDIIGSDGNAMNVPGFTKTVENVAGSKAVGESNGKFLAAAAQNLPRITDNTNFALDTAQKLLTHPGMKGAVGVKGPGNFVSGSPEADFKAQLNQAKGQAFLAVIDNLRGIGRLTNMEIAGGKDAVIRMQTATSEEAFKEADSDYQAVLRAGLTRAQNAATGKQPLAVYPPQAGTPPSDGAPVVNNINTAAPTPVAPTQITPLVHDQLPAGATQIGTSGGKAVYQTPDGKKFLGE